jgi:hypothetical protein
MLKIASISAYIGYTGVRAGPQPDRRHAVLGVMVGILFLILILLYSTNIPSSMLINRVYETQYLLSL